MRIKKIKHFISPILITSFTIWLLCILIFIVTIFCTNNIPMSESKSDSMLLILLLTILLGIISFGIGLIETTYKFQKKKISQRGKFLTFLKIIFLLSILPIFLLWNILQPILLFKKIKSLGFKQYWKKFRLKPFIPKAIIFFITAFIILPLWLGGYVLFFYGTIGYNLEQKNTSKQSATKIKLPPAEGEKAVAFAWKYKGTDYNIDKVLYDSYYQFYGSLPKWKPNKDKENPVYSEERTYNLFVKTLKGDSTIEELADSIRSLGQKNNLNEDQIIELALSFVQTIPYDYEKFDKINAGERTGMYFPYEVLYKQTGVCSDKSFLAYSLIKELGYGVALFSFINEEHMALAIKCPMEYSSYESGYCFAETTSLGNKIGTIPEIIPQKGVAVSNREFGHYGDDNFENSYSLLTNIGIFNQTDGKTYTGIIATISTQKEINNLQNTLHAHNNELKKLGEELDKEDSDLKSKNKKLNGLFKKEKYDDYLDYYKKYEKSYKDYEKARKAYNKEIEIYNQISDKYDVLVKNFYQ